MTKLLSEREVGGVPLLTVEISEGEAEVLLSVLDYFLARVAQSDIESFTGAYPDEVKGIRDDACYLIGRATMPRISVKVLEE